MLRPLALVRRWLGSLPLTFMLPLFALLLLAAVWSVAAYQISGERSTAIRQARIKSDSLALAYEQRTTRIVQQLAQITQFVKFEFEHHGGTRILPDLTASGVLPTTLARQMTVLDANGAVIAGTTPSGASADAWRAMLLDEDDTDDDGLRIGRPVLSETLGQQVVPFSRRLRHADGSLAGVVIVAVPQMRLTDYYRHNDLGAQGSIALLGTDGTFRALRSGDRLLTPPPGPPLMSVVSVPARHDAALAAASLRAPRIVSYRPLPTAPLIAVVGLAEPQAYGSYQRRRTLYLSGAGCASFVILAFIALLLRQSRRLQNSMRAARQAQEMYGAVVEGGLDAFYVLKARRDAEGAITDFGFVNANRRATQLFGLAPAQLLDGRGLRQLPPFPGSDGFFEKCAEVTASHQLLEEEREARDANGNSSWWQHQWIPLDDGVAVTSRDITSRKQIENRSRQSHNFLQSLIEYLPTLIYVKNMPTDRPGEMVIWNKAAEEVTGYPASQVVGRTLAEIFPPARAQDLQHLSDRMMVAPRVIDLPEYPFRRPDGSEIFLRTISLPLLDENDKPEYLLGIAVDITERRTRELELRTSQAELAAASDSSPLGVFRTDAGGRCTYVNRAYEQMSGQTAAQSLGSGWVEAVHPQDRLKVFQGWSRTARDHTPYQGTYRFLHADDRVVWVSVKSAAIVVDGQLLGYVGSVDDITARRAAEKALEESERHLRTTADTLPALVAFVGADQRFRFNNLAYERKFGIAREAIRGMSMRELIGEALYQRALPWIEQALAGTTVTFEIDEHRNGAYSCLETTYTPEFDADEPGRVLGFHLMAHDITAKKIHERRLVEMARIDSLTGLLNRAGFEARLEQAMANSRHTRALMAVIYLDVDHFKQINDTYGHAIGDALLKSFVARLLRTLRSTDSVARLGGDEFTIIMENLPQPESAVTIAAKIGQTMRPLFALEGRTVQVSASIGLAYYRGGDQTREQLLKQADDMLYEAKNAGRDTYRIAPPPAD